MGNGGSFKDCKKARQELRYNQKGYNKGYEGSSDVNGAALQGWQDSNNPEEGYDDTYAEEAVETDY